MINEERTLKDFEHTSDMLTHGSNEKVWRICEGCGKESEVIYNNYTNGNKICRSCAKKSKRGPFNIEYFGTVQESIDNGNINEIKTFNEFKYYSIDLTHGNNKKVWRICEVCGKEDAVSYNKYILGQKRCRPCGNKGKTHSEETLQKMSGKNNSFYGKHHTEETKKKLSEDHAGTTHSEETRQKLSAIQQGIPYDEWVGFLSENLYAEDFTQAVRREVRASTDDRDFLTGVHKDICNDGRELDIHHIDYDKQNTAIKNLIPLSRSNHAKTNTNRKFWIKLFTNMQNTRYLLLESEATHE